MSRRDTQLAEAERLARLGSWHIEGKTNAVALSEESFRILGKSPQPLSISFGDFLDCIHPDDRTLLTDVLHAPDVQQFGRDLRIVRKDGELRHVHIRGDIARDPAGWASEATGMIQDITECKASEQELQKVHDGWPWPRKPPMRAIAPRTGFWRS